MPTCGNKHNEVQRKKFPLQRVSPPPPLHCIYVFYYCIIGTCDLTCYLRRNTEMFISTRFKHIVFVMCMWPLMCFAFLIRFDKEEALLFVKQTREIKSIAKWEADTWDNIRWYTTWWYTISLGPGKRTESVYIYTYTHIYTYLHIHTQKTV
jgi:hypothetical protein